MFKKISIKIKKLLSIILKEKSDHLFVQFFRYFVVSGVSMVIDFSITYSLTEFLKIHYLISSITGNIIGIFINYILNVLWVFNESKIKNRKIEFIIFVVIGFIGLGVTHAIVWFFTEIFKFHYMISKVISIAFGYILRFVLRKYFLF